MNKKLILFKIDTGGMNSDGAIKHNHEVRASLMESFTEEEKEKFIPLFIPTFEKNVSGVEHICSFKTPEGFNDKELLLFKIDTTGMGTDEAAKHTEAVKADILGSFTNDERESIVPLFMTTFEGDVGGVEHVCNLYLKTDK